MLLRTVVYLCASIFYKVVCCKTFLDVFSVDYKLHWAIMPQLQAHVMGHVFNERV